MSGQACIENRMPIGFGETILQCGGDGRLEEVCAVKEGFGALGKKHRCGIAIGEERRENLGVCSIRERNHIRRRCHDEQFQDLGGIPSSEIKAIYFISCDA